jgi:hypothetical protein
MRAKISSADRVFITKVLMPYFRIPKLRLAWSNSKERWPDLWCQQDHDVPIITVTQEWLQQTTDERRKRLVHEFIHLGWKYNHGIIDGLVFSTKPFDDDFSRELYWDIVNRHSPRPVVTRGFHTKTRRNPDEGGKVPVPVKPIKKKEDEREVPKKYPPPNTPFIPLRWRVNPLYELYPLYFRTKEEAQRIIDEWNKKETSGRVRQDFTVIQDELERWRIRAARKSMEIDRIHRPGKRLFNPVLSKEERDRLSTRDFAIPERRAYPIHDEVHARNALARVAQWGTPSERQRVQRAVYARYPDIGKNPSKTIYGKYLKDIKQKWDWPGIVRNLEAREYLRPAHSEYPVYYYLGSYLKVGPDVERGQHFYNRIWHYPAMGGTAMGGYRMGQWLSALVQVAEDHDLHIFMPSDEDPTELYVGLGVIKEKGKLFGHPVDRIEGF